MALILNIETATKNCSVSLGKEGKPLVIKELNNGNYSHAEKLHPFIQEIMDECGIQMNQIDAVAVSKGPGSYTGLRIGVSAAKGLCFASNIPLISIETLNSLATSIQIENGYIVPMLDARRMEVYSAVYNVDYSQQREIQAEIINDKSFVELLESNKVHFLGDGADKCKDVIKSENAVFYNDKYPSSQQMIALSYEKFQNNEFEDVAYFEPFYLKDFVVIPQKKK
ncbi:tRNA threonylcarbamoyladenosine biosynthesis protein TsaB [Tenacibaculum sp. MAR_2009_124]|uniref:tRNA (adenosine(37)-N6)-threonylcarbamoyltransferase complex dimerization subunit type 1 TsaB n=1 Tax=Tenacibaculum sp. MAR_2009_124 TaxID=1250059 RepID=UPI00089C3B80|nr:tRNA (adenosine(37)-N6)-threonylcarbamoyltransferase complex dimerization subunit type 1 TsaB [Tenacibaculum sp. MAR_2009_124]SEC55711.1 tRNA threonylcarbamoyladenosine biosynthesis protein TsaB [Tenacibaculum sp. MAR_2009_124]